MLTFKNYEKRTKYIQWINFQEKQREINSNFGTMFVDESLSHSPNHVQSNLQLRVNITNRQTYGCEIQTKDNKFCDKDTKINFKGMYA